VKLVLVLLLVAEIDSVFAGRKAGGCNVTLVRRKAASLPGVCRKGEAEDLHSMWSAERALQ